MTEGSRLAFRQAAADFRSLWEAMAQSSTTGARGNYVFALLLRQMLRSVCPFFNDQVPSYPSTPWGRARQEIVDLIGFLYFLDHRVGYEAFEESHYAFNGPLYGEPFDGPVRTRHLEYQADGTIYVDQRQVYKFIVETWGHLAEEAPDGV